jgi:N-sulfoglucosamine sulfohydrolase
LPWSAGDPSRYDPAKLTVPPYLYGNEETREAMCKYFAEVTDFDREVGECVKLVKEAGVEDNTIFICTTEQGAQFPHGKWTCYDVGLHVGLIIRWPDRVQAGSTSKAMVQYVDIVPTLIDAAGGKPVDGLDGRSFLPVLLGKTDKHNEVVYGVHTTRGIIAATPEGYPIRSIRTETHKYIMNLNHKAAFHNVLIKGDKSGYWNSWVEAAKTDPKAANLVERYQHRPAEEFYDIVRDPYELENLADDPTQRERMDELRQKLEGWMDQQGDKGLETELQRPPKEAKPSKPVKNEAKAPRLRKRADRK